MATLKSLGEFGLIDQIKRTTFLPQSVIKGIGDDTAVLPLTGSKYLLFTTDMIVEGVHFKKGTPPGQIGHKAIACNISDIAAMGGIPTFAVVSLGASSNIPLQFVSKIYAGMERVCRKFGVSIVGGDTVRSDRLLINIAMLGKVSKKCLTLRSGAKVGNEIFVSGKLGGSLKSGRHLTFTPRIKESQFLVNHFHPTAMIDISDGLASDLAHILDESKVGAVINEAKVPRHAGVNLQEALNDGEDFELLFTLSSHQAKRLKRTKTFPFYPIGHIVEQKNGLRIKEANGNVKRIKPKGYTHF